MAPTNQGLERRGGSAVLSAPATPPVHGLIATAEDLVAQITSARERFHVLSPVTATSKIADGYAAAMSVVAIDLADGSPDVYKDRLMKPNEVALTKVSLMRIAAALGVSWTKTERLDNGRKPNYWNVRVEGTYRAPDGTKQTISASKEVDLSDGSAQAKAMTDAQLGQARLHGQQLAETKAQLRAIRTFGVVAKYTREQLAKPFLVVRFSYVPDTSDPEIKRLVAAAELGVVDMLYAGSQAQARQAPALPEGTDLPAELGGGSPAPRQVGAGASAQPVAAAPEEAFFEDEPDADDRPRLGVAHVLKATDDGDWPIEFTNGTTLVTRDRAVAKAASEAGKSGRAVVVEAARGRIEELQVLDEPAPAQAAGGNGGDGGEGGGAAADEGLRAIADVTHKAGETNGRKWVKFTIVAEGGESWVTFSQTIADDARHAKANGWKVRIEEKQSEKYPDQMDLVSLTPIDPRQGTLLGGAGEKY